MIALLIKKVPVSFVVKSWYFIRSMNVDLCKQTHSFDNMKHADNIKNISF